MWSIKRRKKSWLSNNEPIFVSRVLESRVDARCEIFLVPLSTMRTEKKSSYMLFSIEVVNSPNKKLKRKRANI